jgi:hypothetical protein
MTISQKFFGILSGLIMILAWVTLLLFTDEHLHLVSGQANANTSLFVWILLGPVPLFIGTGMYYSMRSGWTETKKQEYADAFRGGNMGFLLWALVILLFPGIRTISTLFPLFPLLGGYLLIFLLMVFFRWRHRGTGHQSPE